jgi:hypothetical protein
MCLLHVGTLQPSNDGCLEVHLLDNLDETLRNGVASHDTTEDIDKDGSDLGVACDKIECLSNSLGCGTATDVQEVGWRTAVQLDDVHGGHGKTSTVDEAANIAVQLDEVETNLGGLDLIGIFLGDVSPLENLLLAEIGVVVEVQLGIHSKNLVVGGFRERVDLNLGGVLVHEDLV